MVGEEGDERLKVDGVEDEGLTDWVGRKRREGGGDEVSSCSEMEKERI